MVENILGRDGHVNYNAIPSVIYTHPEVATVGATEAELKATGVQYNKGTFPFLANSRAKAINDIDGMVKILACKNTDKLLGAAIMVMNGDLTEIGTWSWGDDCRGGDRYGVRGSE